MCATLSGLDGTEGERSWSSNTTKKSGDDADDGENRVVDVGYVMFLLRNSYL